MILPKFTWNDGSAHTLIPTYPPVSKVPVDTRSAQRTADFSTDGIGQWMTDRVDALRTLKFDYVPAADLASWAAFIDYAIEGNVFTYYPDKDVSGTHFDYTLEDTDWKPDLSIKSADGGYFKFSLNLRKYVTP
jgi:hypothetical protein